MKNTLLVLLFISTLLSCRKQKITSDSLKGNWTFTEYSSYEKDTLETYIVKVVKEGGFINFKGDSTILSEPNKVIFGSAKLPLIFSDIQTSLFYNNGNNYLLESDFILNSYDLHVEKKGNQKNNTVGYLKVYNYSNQFNLPPNDYDFDLIQVSKNQLRLKISCFRNGELEPSAFTLIDLKK